MSSQGSFTFNVAYESDRRNARICPGLLTSSPVVDHIQGFLSIITGTLIMIIYSLGIWILLPAFLILWLKKCRTTASESRGCFKHCYFHFNVSLPNGADECWWSRLLSSPVNETKVYPWPCVGWKSLDQGVSFLTEGQFLSCQKDTSGANSSP